MSRVRLATTLHTSDIGLNACIEDSGAGLRQNAPRARPSWHTLHWLRSTQLARGIIAGKTFNHASICSTAGYVTLMMLTEKSVFKKVKYVNNLSPAYTATEVVSASVTAIFIRLERKSNN